MSQIKTWYAGLQEREQKLVLVMSVLIGIFLFYSLIWQPLNNAVESQQKKVAKQEELLLYVEENIARIQQLKRSGSRKVSGSLSSVVNRSVNRFNVSVSRMQPQGDTLQVWLDEVVFSDLLEWLDHLTLTEGLVIKSVDIGDGDEPGIVRVRRLQLGKN